MRIFFTLLILSFFSVSIILSNWLASAGCALLLALILLTHFFAERIVKKTFKGLTPLASSIYAHHLKSFEKIFSNENPSPKVYLADELSPLQIYAFGSFRKINIVLSPSLLEHISDNDLKKLFKQSYELSKNSGFMSKKHIVAAFLVIASLGRYVDAMLSFFLGIKTKNGEPKALIRKFIYLLARLFKGRSILSSKNSPDLKLYSYLSFYHEHPILSPLSISDMNL